MAIQKQINYQVNFQANTANVQSALANLQNTLNNISKTPIAMDDGSIKRAKQEANELAQALKRSVNVNTGKLDLTKFSSQLKMNKKTLQEYSASLFNLGAQGQQAFTQLAQSIAQSEIPLRKTNRILKEMGITLKNTIKWQISSNLLMGFTQGISNAVQYTKDLNKNLNDIRIVSGQSADQMERFAEKANKAAKALSSSTNEYTKAALIYYQQGLNDQQVKERTDATIKMANVTGDAADDVSSYMTAIWNNFDNGSKSLEYYADVMTALGAATASSTDEIATGLEKFAGIAETVGLSYEYATSALATLVAETRQSPETVGTALKTIFSRLQGLKLGETLDDGTSLNKYSEALATVGVNIKNSNGTLKDMDLILEELASKWNLIGKDQQMALAQTVGGVRQYTQLITLMDNWGDMQSNLNTAFGAEGELNKQAEIYAESWEAASERTRASLEALYSELIPEDLLIDLTKMFGNLVDAADGFIEGFGGIVPMLNILIASLATKLMPQLISGASNMYYNFQLATGQIEKQNLQLNRQLQKEMEIRGLTDATNANYQEHYLNTQKILELEERKVLMQKSLTKEQIDEINRKKEQLMIENQILEARYKQEEAIKANTNKLTNKIADKTGMTYDQAKQSVTNLKGVAAAETILKNNGLAFFSQKFASEKDWDSFNKEETHNAYLFAKDKDTKRELAMSKINYTKDEVDGQYYVHSNKMKNIEAKMSSATGEELQNLQKDLKQLKDAAKAHGKLLKDVNGIQQRIQEKEQELKKFTGDSEEDIKQRADLEKALGKLYDEQNEKMANLIAAKRGRVIKGAKKQGVSNENIGNALELGKEEGETADKEKLTEQEKKDIEENNRRLKEQQERERRAQNTQATIQGVTSAMTGLYSMIQSIQSLGSIWSNDDLSLGEKIASSVMSVSMALSGLSSVQQGLNMLKSAGITISIKETAQKIKNIVASKAEIAASKKVAAQKGIESSANAKNAMTLAISKLAAGDFVTIGLVVAGLALAGFSVYSHFKAKKTETAKQTVEDYQKESEKSQEKQSSYQAFKQQYDKYLQDGVVTKELEESAKTASEALGFTAAEGLLLTKNFEKLNKELAVLSTKDLEALVNQGKSAIEQQGYLLEQSLYKGQGHASGNKIIDTMISSGTQSDSQIGNLVRKGDYTYLTVDSKGNIVWEVEQGNYEQQVALINEIQKLVGEIRVNNIDRDSAKLDDKLIEQLTESKELMTIKEGYEALVSENSINQLQTYIQKNQYDETQSYEKYRNQLIKDNIDISLDVIKEFLKENFGNKETIIATKENQKNIIGNNLFLDALWDDKLSLGIEVYPHMTEEAYKAALSEAQNIADQTDKYLVINAKVKALQDFEKIKGDETKKQEFIDTYLTAGKSGYIGVSVDTFFGWDKTIQTSYLKQDSGGIDVSALTSNAATMISGVKNIDNLNTLKQQAENNKKDNALKKNEEQQFLNFINLPQQLSKLEESKRGLEGLRTVAQTAEYDKKESPNGHTAAYWDRKLTETEAKIEELQNSTFDTDNQNVLDFINKQGYSIEELNSDMHKRSAILQKYLDENDKINQAAETATNNYETTLSQIQNNLRNFTTNSIISLNQTENLDQFLKVFSQINEITKDYNNNLNDLEESIKKDLQEQDQQQKIYNKVIGKLKELKNSVPGVSGEITNLQNLLKNPNTENFQQDLDNLISKIQSASQAFEHFKKFANLSDSLNSDITAINRDPTGNFIETQQSFANVEQWLLNNFGISTDTQTLQTKWTEFAEIIQNTAGKSIGEVQWALTKLFNADTLETTLAEEFKKLGENIDSLNEDVTNILDTLDFSTPEGLRNLKEAFGAVETGAQKVAILMAALPGLVPPELVTKYKFVTSSIEDTMYKKVLGPNQFEYSIDDSLYSELLEAIDNSKIKGVTRDQFNKFIKQEDGKFVRDDEGRIILKGLYLGENNGVQRSFQRDFLEPYKETLKTELDNENFDSIFENALKKFGDNLNTAFNSILNSKANYSNLNELVNTEQQAGYLGQITDIEEAISKNNEIIDSPFALAQDKEKALNSNKQLRNKLKTSYSSLQEENAKMVQNAMGKYFTPEGKINPNVSFGTTSQGNTITPQILGEDYINEIFKELGIDVSQGFTNEQLETIYHRVARKQKEREDNYKKEKNKIEEKYNKESLTKQEQQSREIELKNLEDTWEAEKGTFEVLTQDFSTIFEWQKNISNNSNKILTLATDQETDDIKAIDLNFSVAKRNLEIKKAQIEKSLALTENSNDLNELAVRIERQGDLTRIAFKEYEIAKYKYKNLLDKEQASDEEIHNAYMEMLNAETEALNSQKTAYEELTNVVDKYYDQMDHLTEGSDTIISVTESMKEILGNLNKESQKAISDTNRTLITLKNKNLEILKQERDINQAIVEELRDKLAEAEATGNQVGIDMYRQQLNEATSKWRESEEELMSELASTLDEIGEIYEETIDNILKEWSEVAAGLQTNLESLSDEFKKQKDIQEQYLDDETQIYELDKMRRTINKELAGNKNLIAQQKLSDVLEKINEIQEKGIKMSEYDLKMLQARYDLRKAEIALEEAQNNKSEVRLMRNAQGNWSYVFTANQNAIADAEQKVADEQEKIRNESEDYSMQVQEKLIEMEKERQEALAEAYKEYRDDEKALQKETERINAYYNSKFQYFGSELSKTLDVLGIDFSDTSYSILTGYKSWDEAQTQFAENGVKYLDQMSGALGQFKTDSKDAMEAAGQDIDTFATNVKDVYAPQVENAMTTVVDSIGNKCKEMLGQIEQMVEDMIALMNSVEWKTPKGSGSSYKTFIDKDGDTYTGIDDNGDGNADWFFSAAARGYDTGGYTGDWNSSDGKIAILHEKELVLNKADTKNILSAVDIMRSIVGSSYGQMRGLANAFSVNNITTPATQLEQRVYIDATFPGVTNALEIETALNNIVNDVAQYTQKK